MSKFVIENAQKLEELYSVAYAVGELIDRVGQDETDRNAVVSLTYLLVDRVAELRELLQEVDKV